MVAAPPVPVHEGLPPALRPGTLVDHFVVGGELGRGGFGVVYEAKDQRLGRLVAIKVVRPGTREVTRERAEILGREAEAAARLDHPNIVTVHDVGRCEAGPYVVMERLQGETLQDRLDRGAIPATEAVRIVREVARGVAHAHGRGVVHLDLKPSNVFLRRDGSVKVLDFGLARLLGGGAATPGGTPDYMAPEQEAGLAGDERTDVWALGTLLGEAIGPARGDARLQRLVDQARARDPAARPADAGAFLAALPPEAGSARPARRRAVGLAVLLGAVVVGLAVVAWLRPGPVAAGPVTVAVADAENASGDPDLDGLSGLLATSLEQSARLRVLSRARLLDAMGAAAVEGGGAGRIDEASGREAGRRSGAGALLVPSVRKDGEGFALEVRGSTTAGGAPLFTARERAASKGEVQAALDRLARAARLALQEREADVAGADVRLAEAVTSSLAAYQHYVRSQECMYQTSFGQDCAEHLEKALAEDPTFALAHYQLAVWRAHHGGSREEQARATAAALRHVDRVPPKERLLIRAWAAHFDGRDDEALAHLEALTRAHPFDEEGIYEAGDLLFHRSEFDRAAPWFERQLSLDPALAHGWGLEHLAHSLGALGRTDDLRRLADGWARAPANPVNLHALATARGWLGDLPGVVEAARRAALAGGGLSAAEDEAYAGIMAGRYAEVRSGLAPLAAPGSPAPVFGQLALAALDAYQGRREAGRQRLDALTRDGDPAGDDTLVRGMRIQYLAGDGDAHALAEEVRRLAALDPEAAAVHASLLAWMGDVETAAALAPRVRAGSPRRRILDAVVAWQGGAHAAALKELHDVAATSPYDVDFGLSAAWLEGDLAARSGADAQAVEALRRFRALYVPTTMWRSWALPRSLVVEAGALARLGRTVEARAALDRFLAEWSEADAGEPLLAAAHELAGALPPVAGKGG
jgi:tetratricopeptide (TPR) repeat protein